MKPENRYCNYPASQMKVFITGLILPLLLFSCVTQRNLEYLRDKNDSLPAYKEAANPEYQLKPDDALYIQISSLDDAASNVFAQSSAQQTLDPYGAYMSSYKVDKEGYIQLPVIGKIQVSGKTTSQVSDLIKDSVVNILSLPVITVKLVNQYVSVLGEVRTPGHFVYSQDKFTIYNAISLAGDINEYGNRREVILVRNEKGINNKIHVDLTRADILSSPYYFIQPNDLIYVSPLRKRFWGMREFPFAVIMTTITTAIVVYTFILQQQP